VWVWEAKGVRVSEWEAWRGPSIQMEGAEGTRVPTCALKHRPGIRPGVWALAMAIFFKKTIPTFARGLLWQNLLNNMAHMYLLSS
jgi:hypothetical protein